MRETINMWHPGPSKRTTPAQWKVIGCSFIGVGLFILAFGIYAGIKHGFDHPNVPTVVLIGALLTAGSAGAWYAIRWMMG
jgi:antibiotic biosynthesis monooxygenase (ABM) superfamily enzyme